MGKKLPIFYSALLLTGVNLLLRFAGTSFQVYLSGKIGASGIGLLQLVLSVGALAMTAGMGGIRTATMYLTAETVGQKNQSQMPWVLSGCILYSIALSTAVSTGLYFFAPSIADKWIGNQSTLGAIRMLAFFLPVNCLCGVMIGYFTGINKIGTLATVEVLEQLISMPTTILLLKLWADSDPEKACIAVIMGSGIGACFTVITLVILRHKEKFQRVKRISVRKKLFETAIPLAIADNMKAGISTTENLMVPKRLELYPHTNAPLAAFGMVCGMVFPVLMFPAAILFGLAELLIPEMARCNAIGSQNRIRYLTEKSMKITLIYGILCGGILFLSADDLCKKLYNTTEAGKYLKWFSILAPMLYCDAIVDAITKGLGKQKICVVFNIITSIMDVILLFVLLPRYGMVGYFISFLISHMINFTLSILLLTRTIGKINSISTIIYCILAGVTSTIFSIYLRNYSVIGYSVMLIGILWVFGTINSKDFTWLMGLIYGKKKPQRKYSKGK